MTSNPTHLDGFLFEESGFTAQLCLTPESLEVAYQLRYRAYRSVDGIPENREQIATDEYDLQPNARTHLIWYDGQPVASARSLIYAPKYDWQGTTCVDAYRTAVKKKFGREVPLLESNRYVVDPEFKGRKSLSAQYLIFRIQTMSCLFDRCRYVITAVRSKHVPFYERLMGFYPISEPIQVNGFQFNTLLLATPYENRALLAKKASIAAFQLEDYERYVSHLNTLVTV